MSNINWGQSYFLTSDVNEALCPLCSVVDQRACEHEEEE